MSKVVELDLEGMSPELVKGWAENLPNLMQMQKQGIWGRIKSVEPPVAPLAWTCAQTGRRAGAFGFWDFKYRDDFSYGLPKSIQAKNIIKHTLYSMLPVRDKKIATINLPFTWPPPRIPGGYAVSDFTMPGLDQGYTWPKTLAKEVEDLVGEYILDALPSDLAPHAINPESYIERVYRMDRQRFDLLNHFMTTKQCDYIVAAIMGTERLPRFFYRYFDGDYQRNDEIGRYSNVIRDHYKYIDDELGRISRQMDDDTILFIHSNYGMQRVEGHFNLCEWLIREGYLTLYEYPSQPVSFEDLKVNWSRTNAWSMGRNGELYINLKGREAQGAVEPSDYDQVLDDLIDRLKQLKDRQGDTLETRIFKRDDIYSGPSAKFGPDLFVSINGYRWCTTDEVGFKDLYAQGGPDEGDDVANGLYGYFCISGPGVPADGERDDVDLIDVVPTILNFLSEEIGEEMEGKAIICKTEDEEEEIRSRLTFLGY